MSDFVQRALGVLLSARFFLPAIALGALGVFIEHSAVLALLLAVQAVFAASATRALGYELEQSFLSLMLRRGSVLLVCTTGFAILLAFLIGWPLMQLLAKGGLGWALLLSLGFLTGLLSLIRVWPAFGLAMLWDDAYPERGFATWIGTALSRIVAFALHLTAGLHRLSGAWLSVALAQATVVAGALALAGIGNVLPSEFRTLGLWLYLLALCPVAHLITLWRVEQLLISDDEESAAPAELVEAAIETTAVFSPTRVEPASVPALDAGERDAALLNAAAAGQVEVALNLLREGASANALPGRNDRDQRSALMSAALLGDLRLLRELIARGAEVNRAVNGLTALLLACRDSLSGRAEAVITLLANGADIGSHDAEGNTALHYAAVTEDPTVAAALLDAGAAIEALNRDGYAPLAIAARAGNEALVKLLLERGARVDPERGVPALIAAANAQSDIAPIVKRLLKAKANINARDRLGRSALHAAALHGHGEICELLMAAGIDLDARDSHGVTALMEAARAGGNRVLARMLFRKPAANPVDAVGRTALHLACQSRQSTLETVQSLLTMGVDPGIASKDGKRAVDYAAQHGRFDFVAAIDPDYPLPNAIRDGAELAVAASNGDQREAERLRLITDALRAGRLAVAEELLALEPALSQRQLQSVAEVALDLDSSTVFECLRRQGLSAEAADMPGRSLLLRALDRETPALFLADFLLSLPTAAGGGVLQALLSNCAQLHAKQAEHAESLALELLARGADPFAANNAGVPLLNLVSVAGYRRLLAALLARGSDPNQGDAEGETALFVLPADDNAAEAVVGQLIRAGARPEQTSRDGRTALGAALLRRRKRVAEFLHWPDWPLPCRRLRDNDLVAAAKLGDGDAVNKLLALGLDINARDAQGCTALLRASGGGYEFLLEELLQQGADWRIAADNGATALGAAISARRDKIARRLLSAGADANQPMQDGLTPLMLAAALGQVEVVDALFAAGADASRQDRNGNTALHTTALLAWDAYEAEPAKSLFVRLLERGCPINQQNSDGQSALLLMLGARAQAGQPVPNKQLLALLDLLIARGADLDCQDQRGVSVLHAAAMHGAADLIERLLKAGADTRRRDTLGRSAYDVAVLLGFVDIAGRLKRD